MLDDGSMYPVIPKISGDLILETFTHRSLYTEVKRNEGTPAGCDNRRLAIVGELVLKLVVTNVLYHKKPTLKASNMTNETDAILSNENMEKWTTYYCLRDKLRFNPDARNQLVCAEETRTLFNAYIGAVFLESGLPTVSDWIAKLINSKTKSSFNENDTNLAEVETVDNRPAKKVKSESPSPDKSCSESHPSLQFSSPPPAITGTTQLIHARSKTATHNPNAAVFLPSFNQKCSQNKLQVEYQAEFRGPPHAGQWEITCIVNGVIKGHGHGNSKQIAKEEAAKQAFYGMGWNTYAE